MEDQVLVSIIVVPVTIIVLLVLAMVMIGYSNEEPSNPLGSIPKVIIDHVDGETVVTVIAVGEHRYDAIHINYTAGNETHNLSALNRYSLDTNISQLDFVLNVTVISDEDHYMLNCTVVVDRSVPTNVYIEIQEEGDARSSRHRSPFTILAEWRDLP